MIVLGTVFATGLALWVVAPVIWAVAAPIAAGEANCPNCGLRPEADAQYCSNCGARTVV